MALIRHLGLADRVAFLGYLSNPFDAFLQIDINLMCSRNEALGRVTIEAMAANIPTIGYKGGGTMEILIEHKTGLFYENGANELASKMLYLIENEQERLEMGNFSRKIFEEKYTSEVYANQIYKLLVSP
jgi:glycosyltransferase involved in cell wall biosynthesis